MVQIHLSCPDLSWRTMSALHKDNQAHRNISAILLQQPFVCSKVWDGRSAQTHTQTHTHSHRHGLQGHRVQTGPHQSYVCVGWPRSTGTAERRSGRECHISLCPSVHKHMSLHAQKQTAAHCFLVICWQWHTHSWALTHTHTYAQQSTCLHRLSRCRSLGEVG